MMRYGRAVFFGLGLSIAVPQIALWLPEYLYPTPLEGVD
jgi:hypothetical protein